MRRAAGAVVGATGAGSMQPDEAVQRLYRTILARPPTDAQRSLATTFLTHGSIGAPRGDDGAPAATELTRVEQLAQVLLMSNETFFID